MESDGQRLEKLIQGQYPIITMVTEDEDHALGLVRDALLARPFQFFTWSFVGGLRDGLVKDLPPVPDTEAAAAALRYLLKQKERWACVLLDITAHLTDERNLRLLRDAIEHCRRSGSLLVCIDHRDGFPQVITTDAAQFDLQLPDDAALEDLARSTLRRLNEQKPIHIDISRRSYQTILRNLRGLSRRQAEQIIIETVAEDRRLDEEDIHVVLTRKRQRIHRGGLLEFMETPAVLGEIGGMRRLKRWLTQRQAALSDEAERFGLPAPRGVLMLGVQGSGKSFCAKAIATAWGRPLLRMDVGALYDKYIGESERRLRDALQQAEMMAPIILWIDEIEKCFASAASRSTDGGLSQRMFGSLLTWMQEHRAPVFLVATANDIEALPPELLRKGRFDEIFFVDLPKKATRREIFTIHLRKRGRDPKQFDLAALTEASDGFSGAEIEQAIVAAMYEAFSNHTEVTTQHVLDALSSSPPLSVTMADRVQALQIWARGRCVPAD